MIHMKKLRLFTLFLVLLLANHHLAYAQYITSEKELEKTIQSFTKALEDGDTATLRTMTAKKLTYGHSSGKVQNQKEFLTSLSDGSSDFVKIDITDQHIDVFGHTAVVRHILLAQTNDNGSPGNVRLKILLVFQKQKEHWVVLARQAVKMAS